ncbi:hypothetical protein D3C76_1125210 [compost metagenome]
MRRHLADDIEGGGDAVELVVVYRIATRVDVEPLTAKALDRQARGLLQHFGEVVQALVVHALAGDHADRLRRFPWRQVKACTGACSAQGVGTGAVGAVAVTLAVDVDSAQFQRRATGRRTDQVTLTCPLQLQARAGKQLLQGLGDAHAPLHGGRLTALGSIGGKQDAGVGLLGQGV